MLVPELHGIKRTVEAKAKRAKVMNLASSINKATLAAIHKEMDGKKAVGVDGVNKWEYQEHLDENLDQLLARMKNGSYRPHPSRRTYIDKPGSTKKRPLGISCYEDKLVEKAVAQLLEIVYEPRFLNCSYGFRPDRNCHQAVREVVEMIQYRKTNYIVEADIRSFFDTLDHEWLIKFLEHDIADKKFIDIIRKLLKAGILEDGKLLVKEEGSPQGGGASAALANVYLHHVLDMWFEKVVRKQYNGEAYLIRYADDFVCCFQYKDQAERFYAELKARMAKFNLALAEEKTRILEFGRFAAENRKARGEGKPETFSFLGFTFYCGMDGRKQFFRVKVKTDRKKVISKLKKLNVWLKEHRHYRLKDIIERINQSLRGHYQYYGVTDNTKSLERFLDLVTGLLFKWLNRRSQRRSYSWREFNTRVLGLFPLLRPKIKVSLFYR
jgi:group II intron reverse transcriptase/maturase